jgi:DNA-directed RNA polymerase omega subunit
MAENDVLDDANGIDDAPPAQRQRVAPIESRFLYVDVAAMRAKQLRRGALVRLSEGDEQHDPHKPAPHKPERIAMEEVRRGLVPWDVPVPKGPVQTAS